MNVSKIKELHIVPTYKCNSRCLHCLNHIRKDEVNLDLSMLDSFFSKNKFCDLDTVVLTGGQIDLHPNIIDLCEIIGSRVPAATVVFTANYIDIGETASLIEKVRAKISSSNLLYVSLPLEGPPYLHKQIRGVDSSLPKLVEHLRSMALHNSMLGTSFTITPFNYHALYWAYAFSKANSLDFWASPYSKSYFYNNLGQRAQFKALDKHHLKLQIDKILFDLSQERDETKHIYFSGLRQFMCSNEPFPMPTCHAGEEFVVIDSQGNLKPCILIDKIIGTIDTDCPIVSPDEIRKQYNCSCWTVCHAYKMAKEHRDG
ncbi:radical SAM protein [Desulfomicrobium baculatum]|nr:radical SAM protein [Desulfomicrobium baculatum]